METKAYRAARVVNATRNLRNTAYHTAHEKALGKLHRVMRKMESMYVEAHVLAELKKAAAY